jgi:hypothetical protein
MPEAEPAKGSASNSGSGIALHSQNLQKHNQAGSSGARASIESCASRASSVGGHSMRSSFAAEAAPEGELAELDHYGRPSFAAFEANPKTGRGEWIEVTNSCMQHLWKLLVCVTA